MRSRRGLFESLTNRIDLQEEAEPAQPILELLGGRRVLLEYHDGVTSYEPQKVVIQVRSGQIYVCGAGLELNHMSRERLIISGRIDSIEIMRGE